MKIIFLILLIFIIYACIENSLIITKKYFIRQYDKIIPELKIVQISDIHKKRNLSAIAKKAAKVSPDLIFLTGDSVSRTETDFSKIGCLAKELTKICPVYAVFGNHELDLSPSLRCRFVDTLTDKGVIILDNEIHVFSKDGKTINIAGETLKKEVYKNDKGYSGLIKYTSDNIRSDIGEKKGFTILLAHNPLCFEAYARWGADLVFCGHVHGGAVRLPGIGGILSPERKFFPLYSKGLYLHKNTVMIVSGGIGKPRLFNPPEIVVCCTYKKQNS